MASEVASAEVAAAIEQIGAGLDALARAGVAPVDAADARRLITELEVLGRRVQAAQIAVVGEIERRGLHKVDGHASAKVLVRHVARLSDAEASRRAQAGRALRDLPVVAAGFAAGRIGRCQVERIARAHANVRVRSRLIGEDQELAILAASVPYRRFDSKVTEWVSLLDEDGTCDTSARNHAKRDCRHVQDPDGSWRTVVFHGSLQGAVFDDILRHFMAAEFEADWAKARLDHGDATTKDHLARTDAQRRYDAFLQVAQVAAAAGVDLGGAGGQITTDIVIGHELFERLLARLAADQPAWGGQPDRPDPTHRPDRRDAADQRLSDAQSEEVEQSGSLRNAHDADTVAGGARQRWPHLRPPQPPQAPRLPRPPRPHRRVGDPETGRHPDRVTALVCHHGEVTDESGRRQSAGSQGGRGAGTRGRTESTAGNRGEPDPQSR